MTGLVTNNTIGLMLGEDLDHLEGIEEVDPRAFCPHAGNGLGMPCVSRLNTERPHALQPRATTSHS
jgi:hypothetical protein